MHELFVIRRSSSSPTARASDLAHTDDSSLIALDACPVLASRAPPRDAALPLSAVGAPDARANLTPACPATMHTQEIIPVVLAPSLPNAPNLAGFLLRSGLAGAPSFFASFSNEAKPKEKTRRSSSSSTERPSSRVPTLAPPGGRARRPFRPPKAPGGALYARYCAPVRSVLSLHVLAPECKEHMVTFHRWMNDEHVNSGGGEKGSLAKHVEYVRGVVDDPHMLPLIMSWDGARMGYVELVWIKENHVAPYAPLARRTMTAGCTSSSARTGSAGRRPSLSLNLTDQHERLLRTAQAWFRSNTHYIFHAEVRTARVVGEPKRANAAIVRTSVDAGMHLETSFYFSYKQSMTTMNLRECLFKEDVFH
ncbi:GNAT domain-containing protein [Phellopilus nigrolimitatus]|nr:GNAT domain-containing protein [Phellopilus nigrolimitatus]